MAAVASVQPALDRFYGLLSDEQKARLNALAENQRRRSFGEESRSIACAGCDVAQVSALKWPTEEIEARLRPTEAQRAKLVALQDTSSRAADMLKTSCQPDDAVTPSARLRCRQQEARDHAAGGQAGAFGTCRFLRNTQRRAEGPVRGDRSAANNLRLTSTPASMAAAGTFSQIDFQSHGRFANRR